MKALVLPFLLFTMGCGSAAKPGIRIFLDSGPDTAAPACRLVNYADREERVRSAWRGTQIEMRRIDLLDRRAVLSQFRAAGLGVEVVDPMLGRDDDFAEIPARWAEEGVSANALDILKSAFPGDYFVDDAGVVCLFWQPEFASQAPPGFRDARDCERLVAINESDRDLEARLKSDRISVDQKDATLYDIVDAIQEVAQVNIVIGAPLRRSGVPDRKTSFSCHDELLGDALARLVAGRGLKFTVSNRVILIGSQDDDSSPHELDADHPLSSRPVRIHGSGLALREVAVQLGAALSLDVVIDPVSWRRSAIYDFDGLERSAGDVITLLRQGAPLEVVRYNGRLWFLAPRDRR